MSKHIIPQDSLSNAIIGQGVYHIDQDPLIKKYGNESKPIKAKDTRNTLTPYVGPWNKQLAIHLLKRAMFGATPAHVNTILSMTPGTAVDALLYNVPIPPVAPVNYYNNIYPDTTGVAMGASWINADYGDGTINFYRSIGLRSMWLKNMIDANISLQEKMVFFLSNLVPVGASTVGDARFEYLYYMKLHQFAMGNYKTFLREITKDGAMLQYLNGYVNNKFSPDENYARELQELFSVGKEGGQPFSETDVIEAAKVLTGWRLNGTNITTFFDNNYHDTGNKTFSSFYNNTVITGVNGPTAGDTELNALLNMIFSGNSAQVVAKYICKKIYTYFMHYEVTPSIQANIIDPLAQIFINANWELKPVLSALFKSEHFFSMSGLGSYIKNPLDYIIGSLRLLNLQPNPSSNIEELHQAFVNQYYYLRSVGMEVMDPPNVSGFKAYYQSPSYHQLWINSNSFPKRLKWSDGLVSNYGFYVSAAIQYTSKLPEFIATLSNPSDPDSVVNEMILYCYGVDLSTARRDYFKAYLTNNTGNNSYWTTAWNDYISNPTNTNYYNTVRNRVRQMLTDFFHQCENQLC
jgi:uncharacterized protein (DUF1800 family)